MSEGGLRVPLIISGPGVSVGKNHNFAFVTDIAATVSDIIYDAVDERIIGKSLKSALAGSTAKTYADSEPVGLEVTGNSALFKGDFKIVRNRPPNGTNNWELFDLSKDPGETLNLAKAMPEKLQELIEDYEVYAEQNGVIDLPADYNWAEEMTVNTIKRNYLPIIWRGILIVGIIIFAAVAVFLMRRQRNKT